MLLKSLIINDINPSEYQIKYKEKGKLIFSTSLSVVPPGIEPGTQGFSVLCSTNWAMAPCLYLFCECKGRLFFLYRQIIEQLFHILGQNIPWNRIFFVYLQGFIHFWCIFALLYKSIRIVAQLVAHYVRDVGVGRSSRLYPTWIRHWGDP